MLLIQYNTTNFYIKLLNLGKKTDKFNLAKLGGILLDGGTIFVCSGTMLLGSGTIFQHQRAYKVLQIMLLFTPTS